jgi:DNA replication protein DnaC
MERTQVLDLMGKLKLYGMRSAYDEVMATGIKRQHEPPKIVGDLLSAEIAEKQARSIKYQLTVAKLPLAKDIEEFDFDGTPVNEVLVRDLANGTFVADQRNAVLIGGTGTGKSHLAIAIARALIRNGLRGRFFNVVDLVNRLTTVIQPQDDQASAFGLVRDRQHALRAHVGETAASLLHRACHRTQRGALLPLWRAGAPSTATGGLSNTSAPSPC